jgi:ribosomal protein S18 acetylase RimI-like enzyme
METKFKYREALPSDLSDFIRLALAAYGQYKPFLEAGYQREMVENLSDEKTYHGLLEMARGFVCECQGEIVGMVFLVPAGNPTLLFESDWAYIRLLGVLPEYENMGIGRALMRICIDSARDSGENIVALHTSELHDAARHIYESMGFIRHKELGLLLGRKYFLYLLQLGN